MHIAIDESGSFVHTDATDSWNDVVAYVYPESTRRALQGEIDTLRRRFGRHRGGEVKLRDLDEQAYVRFLRRLNELEGLLRRGDGFVSQYSRRNSPAQSVVVRKNS